MRLRRGGGRIEARLMFGVSRGPVHLDRKLYSWQTRLACELLVFRVLSVLFPAVLFFSSPSCIPLPYSCFIRRSRPWRADWYCPCFRILFRAFATRPLSPSRFLPPMSFLTRYLPDRERKSSELNECRVPLEGSLSMPTRETPVLAS